MAIRVPIVSEFNKAGITDAERALERFGVKSSASLAKTAAGFGIVGAAGLAAFNELDKGFDAIVVGTGATGKALDDLKNDAKQVAREVPNSFEEVGLAIADVNTRLGLTGEALQDTTEDFLNLSRITKTDVQSNIANITRVFGDWSVATDRQSATLDTLFRASQLTGIGVDRLSSLVVQFGAPLRQLGFSLEESIALFGKFEKEGVNIETILSGLRQGLGRMAKAGEEPIETFQRLIAEIGAAGSVGEANALALEAFGQRAGPDLAAAIREGRFEIGQLVTDLGASEGSLDAAVEGTDGFVESLGRIKNTVLTSAAPALETFADGVDEIAVAIEQSRIPELLDLINQTQAEINDINPPEERSFSDFIKLPFASLPTIAREFGDAITSVFDESSDEAQNFGGRLQRDVFDEIVAGAGRAGQEAGEALGDGLESGAKDVADAASLINDEIELAILNVERFGADGVENMNAVRDAAAEVLDPFAELQEKLDAEKTFDRLAESLERLKASPGDREETRRLLELVLQLGRAYDDIPPETITRIFAQIDRGQVDQAFNELQALANQRAITLQVATGGTSFRINPGSAPTQIQSPTQYSAAPTTVINNFQLNPTSGQVVGATDANQFANGTRSSYR